MLKRKAVNTNRFPFYLREMRFFIVILVVFTCFNSFSQGFKVRHYAPNAFNNTARSIFETAPGSYMTGGFVVDTINGVYTNRLCIMGLDAQGQITWMKKYGNKKFEYLDPILSNRSYYKQGNHVYYASCVRDSNNAQIGALIKFNLNGDTLWQKIYRDPLQDVIPQMVTGSVDGGFLVTGFFQNCSANTRPCLLIKTDANGNELWRKQIDKPFPNVSDGKAIIQDSASKKIVIGGYQYIGNATSWSTYDHILILDSVGNFIGRYKYAGGNADIRDLIQTRDKKIVAVGTTYQTVGNSDWNRSYVVKFDLNNPIGTTWIKPSFDYLNSRNMFTCVHELGNGDLLIGGEYDTLQALNLYPDWMARLVRMDANGNLVWKKYYSYWYTPGIGNMKAMVSLNLTSDNGYIASLYSANASPNPFVFIKWDSTGCDTSQLWCQMVAAGTNKNYLLEANITLYPNPSQGVFHLTGLNSHTGNLTLSVTDITGREVKRLELEQGLEEYSVDLRDLANGTYLVILNDDTKSIYTGKVIKQD